MSTNINQHELCVVVGIYRRKRAPDESDTAEEEGEFRRLN